MQTKFITLSDIFLLKLNLIIGSPNGRALSVTNMCGSCTID